MHYSKMEYSPAALQAYRHLAVYPKTVTQTRQYLIKKGYGEEEINDAIEQLVQTKVLDDISYAEAYLYSEVISKGRPLFVTKQKLSQKGIDRKIIDQLIVLHEEEYMYGMTGKLSSLYAKKPKKDPTMKRVKKMVSRGYPYGLVIKISEDDGDW